MNFRKFSRKGFLKRSLQAAAALVFMPLIGCGDEGKCRYSLRKGPLKKRTFPSDRKKVRVSGGSDLTLLKNGLIVDGNGTKAFYGDVMLRGKHIDMVTPRSIQFSGRTIECAGKVIAPGFIDEHSHMDAILPAEKYRHLSTPFTEQGVTTFVAGNCGFGMGGFKKNSRHMDMITKRTGGLYDMKWRTMAGYLGHLKRTGITHNMATLVGHGTTRTSMRGFDSSPLSPDEMKEMVYLFDEAMEHGARGVSFGLQYEPGVFATMDEMKAIADGVKKRDKIITTHMKAYSKLSGTYPLKLFGRPHNLLAIDDMIELTKNSGVRMQLSHLIFVGSKTWDTCTEALTLIDNAIKSGMDLKFDTYAYHCGTSVINVFFPEWFLAEVPGVYNDRGKMLKVRAELELIVRLLGFGYEDIQIIYANHPDLNRYNGMLLKDIAAEREMSQFDNFIDFARKSEGRAKVLNHRYSCLDNVLTMMKHPASLFMTDATPYLKGSQNPAVYGNFPRFLQYARDYGLLSLEQVVHKMTGASAERFRLNKRGVLKKGYFADITMFDWENVRDNNTITRTDSRPTGIEAVFINGTLVLKQGKAQGSPLAGMVL